MRDPSGGRTTGVGAVAVLVVATLLVGAGAALGQAAPSDPGSESGPVAGPALAQSDIDPDVVVMRVDVTEDGRARWTVDFRVRLDDENATAAFKSVAADIERNATAYTDEFASGMRKTVASAENRTGRSMALRNVTVEATTETVPQRYGVVTYRFTWTNFAVVDGGRIRAGSALADLFLDAESQLTVAWPSDHEAVTLDPEPTETRETAAVWQGPIDFAPGEPEIVLRRGSGPGLAVLVAAALVLVVAVAGGWTIASRRGLLGTDDGTAAAAPDASDADATGDTGGSAAAAAGEGDGEGDGEGEGEGEGGRDEPPEELLSNEEKVLRLLEREGGRIKQQRIAEAYDWTDAKTSQVVGSLREEDAVETFRIGRENVVTLPEESDL